MCYFLLFFDNLTLKIYDLLTITIVAFLLLNKKYLEIKKKSIFFCKKTLDIIFRCSIIKSLRTNKSQSIRGLKMKETIFMLIALLFLELLNCIVIPFFPKLHFFGFILNILWVLFFLICFKNLIFGFLQFGIDLNHKIDELKESFKKD